MSQVVLLREGSVQLGHDHSRDPPCHYRHFCQQESILCMSKQVPEYYKLMGYEEEAFPAFTPYAPPLLDLPLEEGAAEELPWPHASGVQLPVSEWLAMPDACLLPSQGSLPIGTAYIPPPEH